MIKVHVLWSAVLLFTTTVWGQSTRPLERSLQPKWKMQIYDTTSPVSATPMMYNDIPKTFDYKGTVMESIAWKDSEGDKILILTAMGYYPYRDLSQRSFGQHASGTKGEIYMYMFTNKGDDNGFVMTLKMYDEVACVAGSSAPYIGYAGQGVRLTDLDKDGVAEVIVSYLSSCNEGEEGEYDLKVLLVNGEDTTVAKGQFSPHDGRADKPIIEKDEKTKKAFTKAVEEKWKEIVSNFK